MNRHNYDTVAGIRTSLSSLAAFHQMLRARRNAANLGERLDEFYVLGQWHLDSGGHCHTAITDNKPTDLRTLVRNLPDVATAEEFGRLLRLYDVDLDGVFFNASGSSYLAPADIPCVVCGRTWTVVDAADHLSISRRELRGLDDYEGEPFAAAVRCLLDAIGHEGYVRGEIRNNADIDLSPGDAGTPRNPRGWTEAAGDRVVRVGDEAVVSHRRPYHHQCHAAAVAVEAETTFRMLFETAGFVLCEYALQEIPNPAGSQATRGPWYEVHTSVGVIVVGWHRHVIEIDWHRTGRNLARLFADEGVTLSDRHVHAEGTDQALEFLRRINQALFGKALASAR